MFGFLHSLDLSCRSVIIAIVHICLSLILDVSLFEVFIGFIHVWISAFSGLVL